MKDITERLRDVSTVLCTEAADEIERLRHTTHMLDPVWMMNIPHDTAMIILKLICVTACAGD